jgi:hypothetical protein
MIVWQSYNINQPHDILGMGKPCGLGEAEEPAWPDDQEVQEAHTCQEWTYSIPLETVL